jgi:nucleoside-diphosphate-sugar epimerase
VFWWSFAKKSVPDSMETHKILVTGAAGYVGSVLCRQLLAQGYHVRGLDALLFGGEALLDCIPHPRFSFVHGDLCEKEVAARALEGMDTVIHLAAIVGDPACKKYPDEARKVMDTGSQQLYALAGQAHIKHFIFASTCSNYGVMDGEDLLDEDSPLHPQSHYARLKVGFEQYLQSSGPGLPGWTILRFATAFGHSARPRFDLTVNHFTRDMCLGRPLNVFASDLWRPYCHVHDLARACVHVCGLGEKVFGKTYNVGDSAHNHTKRQIVEAIQSFGVVVNVVFNADAGGDLRNYRVDFARIQNETGFRTEKNLHDGIREIHAMIKAGILSQPFSHAYQNA